MKILANYLIKQYGEKGVSVNELIDDQITKAARDNRSIDRDEAFEEMVGDSMESMLTSGNVLQMMADAKAQDRALWEKIRDWFKDFAEKLKKIINAYSDVEPDSVEGRLVADMQDVTVILEALYGDALLDAAENFDDEAQKNTAKGGVKYQARMTDAEIQAIQDVGRISVNQFLTADIKATERLARQYWREMGVKSPFFRAWFGDWRANDHQTKVQVATQKGNTRGVQKNIDTGWDIQVSGMVFNETTRHTDSYNVAARPYLPYINDIVAKAVWLDSFGFDPKKVKSKNSLLMHSLYAVADFGNGPEILKLYVEEMNDPNTENTRKRSYQLQNVEKYQPQNGSSQKSASSISSATGNIHTVADLFAAVKRFDKSFKPSSTSAVTDSEGRPQVVYHGTKAEQFNTFSYGHIGSETGVSILGDGFYFTDKKKLAKNYGPNIYECYLQMKKPYHATEADTYKLSANTLKAQGYDGVILEAPTGTVYMVFDNTQIKSATENIGTFDGNNPDIRYSTRDTAQQKIQKALEQENAQLQEDVSRLEELLKLQRTVTGGTKFTKTSVEAAARMLKKHANVKRMANTSELAQLLHTFYEAVASDTKPSWDKIKEQARPVACF